MNTNIMGLVNIMECSRIFDIKKTICIGSRAAVGSYKPEEGPLTEDFMPRPEAFYGVTKYAGEMIVEQYKNHFDIPGVSLRVTGIYGPWAGRARRRISWTYSGCFAYAFSCCKRR